jgi:ubiquinone/menaquinone biosynthesis C-methylase UbiE
MSLNNIFERKVNLLIELFEKYGISIDEPVLDLGSGRGKILDLIVEKGYDIWGVDKNKLLVNAHDRMLYADVRHLSDYLNNVEYRIMTGFSVLSVEAQNNAFRNTSNFLLSITSPFIFLKKRLEKNTEKRIDDVIKELARVLPIGGLFFNIEYADEEIGYTRERAEKLGFKVLEYRSNSQDIMLNYAVLQKL